MLRLSGMRNMRKAAINRTKKMKLKDSYFLIYILKDKNAKNGIEGRKDERRTVIPKI